METKDFFLMSIVFFVALWIVIVFWAAAYFPEESRA
jgi:hypothetical protein